MSYIEYDTEIFADIERRYRNHVATMNLILTNMSGLKENTLAGWNSDAGVAFFEKYDSEWVKNFQYYRDVLQEMADMLKDAREKYDLVTESGKKITF